MKNNSLGKRAVICSAWRSSSTFGIRVGYANAQKHFKKNWACIEVLIDGKAHGFSLSKTFWTTCPEFRGKEIGLWLYKHKLAPWQKGRPPKIRLIPLKKNKFRLSNRAVASNKP